MMFDHIFELLILFGTAVLSIFCFLLSRKISRLNNLENGIGGAIAVLISEVERLDRSMAKARKEAVDATEHLGHEIERAKEEREKWVLQQNFSAARDARFSTGSKRILKEHRRQDA